MRKKIVWFGIKLYGLIRKLYGLERNCMVSNHESYGLGRVWGRQVWIITFLIGTAYRLVEPWNSLPWESLSHGLPHILFFLYHEFSSFCDFFVVWRLQTVKNKGHGLLGFYISTLSYTYHIYDQRLVNFGKTEMLMISNFDILQFNLWTSLVSWIISICGEHISRHTRSWCPH